MTSYHIIIHISHDIYPYIRIYCVSRRPPRNNLPHGPIRDYPLLKERLPHNLQMPLRLLLHLLLVGDELRLPQRVRDHRREDAEHPVLRPRRQLRVVGCVEVVLDDVHQPRGLRGLVDGLRCLAAHAERALRAGDQPHGVEVRRDLLR